MATAFTLAQREEIRRKLQDAALRCLSSQDGMRGVTVEELARDAGISKGAFYRFYASKEHLFFSVLTRMHNEMYQSAERVLESSAALPIHERTMRAIAEICRLVQENGVMAFFRADVPLLLQRLPPELVRDQYLSDDVLIEKIIQKAGVTLKTDMRTACAMVRILLMTSLFEDSIGTRYGEALQLMIEGTCEQILA